jgi:hypothetical protein
VTEAFFDNTWFKIREQNLSRSELRDCVQRQIERGQQLELLFPIFSRKPFSPIKNRGFNPDLGEVHSLARCVEAAHVIDTLCPTGCRLTILADGFKYNRACRTPDDIVAIYQSGLRFWADQLDVADVVNVVNYEEWIRKNLAPAYLSARTPLYLDHCSRLTARYSRRFHAVDLTRSLAAVEEVDDVGQQLAFTFWSIVTSTYYTELFDFVAKRSFIDRHYGDDTQRLYLAYAASLHRLLDRSSSDRSSSGRGSALPLGYLLPSCFAYLFHCMRCEAWEATIRYVAISLTDRELNVLNQISPNAIKLTIHGKKGELHFLSATHQDVAMTAQHSTVGLAATDGATKMTFRYRLERESDRERPVLIESLPDTPHHRATYGPLWHMQKIGQPIAYVADPAVLRDWRIHNMLTRKG